MIQDLLRRANASPPAPNDLVRRWDRETRLAVLTPWFSAPPGTRVFGPEAYGDLLEYGPEVIAGPVPDLVRLARGVLDGAVRVGERHLGVVAWSGIGRPALSPAERDILWLAFQAPVFEDFRNWCGELFAWECEAHDGMHVAADSAHFSASPSDAELYVSAVGEPGRPLSYLPTGLTGEVVTETCPCGIAGPRLTGLGAKAEPFVSALALGA